MAIRIQQPDSTILHLSDGEWILVKKRLSAGEGRAMFARMIRDGATGDTIDTPRVALARVLAYLLDWSATTVAIIRNQPNAVVESALDALDADSFREIREAIDTHIAAMDKERAQEKNAPSGAIESSAISPSQSTLAGDTVTS